MALEIELKLLLATKQPQHTIAALAAFVQRLGATLGEPVSLLNAYFETADHWFRRHDCGLRTRQKHNRFEQTIKLSGQQQGAMHVRPEYNVPCQGVVPQLADFPPDIWPQDTDISLLQRQLVEVFRTDFQRRKALINRDGSQIELVLDLGEVIANGQTEAIAEIELELIDGAPHHLFVVAHELLATLPLLAGFQSKAERGYRLAQQQPLQWLDVSQASNSAELVKVLLTNQLLAERSGATDALLRDWQVARPRLLSDAQLPETLRQQLAALAADADLSARQHWLLAYTQAQLTL